jgi:hypothetical protein
MLCQGLKIDADPGNPLNPCPVMPVLLWVSMAPFLLRVKGSFEKFINKDLLRACHIAGYKQSVIKQ